MYNRVKEGNTIKAYGLELEVLDTTFEAQYGFGILCLAKEPIKQMVFSEENNDYTISDVRKFLKEHTKELEEKGAKNERREPL